MSNPRLQPIGEWPKFDVGDVQLEARSFEREDGLRMVHLATPGAETRHSEVVRRDSNRVVYRTFDGDAVLLGLSTAYQYRGFGFGPAFVKYFIDNVNETDGSRFAGTGLIHKPLVALCLSRSGLTPETRGFEAEVLPVSALDASAIPKIHVLHDEIDPELVVDRSGGGKFYEVVPPQEVIRRYPINSPEMTVALHTRYGLDLGA